MKVYNSVNRLSKTARTVIENCVAMHEHYGKSYFWRPGSNSSWRRANESKFYSAHPSFSVLTNKGLVLVETSYNESCSSCYYLIKISLDGVKKDIRLLKSMLSR